MSTTIKKQIFKAMKFRTIKIAKFYSSEIKWVYSNYHDVKFKQKMTSYWLRMLGESIILGQLQFLTRILAKASNCYSLFEV